MIAFPSSVRVWLAVGRTDMRRGMNDLALQVQIARGETSKFLARLPAALAARFDAEQLVAVDLHFGMRHRTRHAIDIRRRLPFLRCYVVLLAGRDRVAE